MQAQKVETFLPSYESSMQELAQQTTLDETSALLTVLDVLVESNALAKKQLPEHWEKTIQHICRMPPEQKDEKTLLISVARQALELHRNDLQRLTEKTALLVRFMDEPGLANLLSDIYRQEPPGVRYSVALIESLLTKIVPKFLLKIKECFSISTDEKEALLKYSPETIINDPHLLHRVLQAGNKD
jgi:hypothetical protein